MAKPEICRKRRGNESKIYLQQLPFLYDLLIPAEIEIDPVNDNLKGGLIFRCLFLNKKEK